MERPSVTSRKPLQDVLAKFDAAVGHPTSRILEARDGGTGAGYLVFDKLR